MKPRKVKCRWCKQWVEKTDCVPMSRCPGYSKRIWYMCAKHPGPEDATFVKKDSA